jgi:FkbM family methyltransferase
MAMNKYVKAILGKVRAKAHDLGYDIRKTEQFCWSDQQALLARVSAPLVMDVGANGGVVTAIYRDMFPLAQIHSFEPMPPTWELLRDRFKADRRIAVHNAAVCAESGPQTFTVNAASDTSSLLSADVDAIPDSYRKSMSSSTSITVPGVAIDSFCVESGIAHIDLLKMDIQGGELHALHGAATMLKKQAVSVIYSEAYYLPFYKAQPLFGDISAYLSSHGYRLHGIYNPTFSGQTGRLQWSDCIFVSAALAEASSALQRKSLRV